MQKIKLKKLILITQKNNKMIQVLWKIRKMIKINLKSIYKIIMIKENNN